MNCAKSDASGREQHTVHSALISFLYPAPGGILVPARHSPQDAVARDADDDKPEESPQTEVSSQPDGAAMHVLLVSPPSPFGAALTDAIGRIDPGCVITHATEPSIGRLPRGRAVTLALIDLDAFGEEGEALIRQLSARAQPARIVALSDRLERQAIDCALEAGAVAYLPKSYGQSLIEGVLRLVMGGERYRPHTGPSSRSRGGRPPGQVRDAGPATDNVAGLTPREKEVLLELTRGCTNLEIAEQLDMKEPTVKTHLHTIFRKLNVRNRAGAALCGARIADIQQVQIDEAEQGKINLSWLRGETSLRRLRPGQWLFRLGDRSSELYYVQRGKLTLPEIGVSVGPGEVFGEIGIFTPERKRTCSARCDLETELLSLTSGQVRRIYLSNPQFALFLLNLVVARLMADRQRAIGMS
jgi:two-component system, NarL family, nitrate/nitrite response regulator NarL